MEQRFLFDEVAALYEKVRPGYPEALYDDVIGAAGLRAGERILEIGSGTGKATAAFARRGLLVTALEPGAQMIAVAKQALARWPSVRFIETTFENWTPEPGAFGLVAAAQSWHWVDPRVSFARAAQVLKPRGVLAIFGSVPVKMPEALREELLRVYARHVPDFTDTVPERSYLPSGPFAELFAQSGLFGAVTHKAYSWQVAHTAETYAGLLASRSDHRRMDASTRDAILADVADAVSRFGGGFKTDCETHLYMARLKD